MLLWIVMGKKLFWSRDRLTKHKFDYLGFWLGLGPWLGLLIASGYLLYFTLSELVRAGLLKWTGQKYLFLAAPLSTHLISTFCNTHDDFSRGLSS